MERVLVTGATGFLGINLCETLIKNKYLVTALHRSTSDISNIAKLKNISFLDIEKKDSIEDYFKKYTIDSVIHCATSYGHDNNPHNVFKANVLLPLDLLEKSIKYGIKRFVNIDSFSSLIKGYPYLPYYHTSKNHFLTWADFISQKTNLNFCTLRLHHMYGPKDKKNKFVPFILESLLDNKMQIDLTEGKNKRDFVHVEDVVNILTTLLKLDDLKYKEIEVGTGISTSIKEFVNLCANLTKNSTTKLNFGKLITRENEIMDAKADTKVLRALGVECKFNLKEGILNTISSLKQNY